jgi:hypothetical protein
MSIKACSSKEEQAFVLGLFFGRHVGRLSGIAARRILQSNSPYARALQEETWDTGTFMNGTFPRNGEWNWRTTAQRGPRQRPRKKRRGAGQKPGALSCVSTRCAEADLPG